jgi:DNA polymerase-3 subunit gamma/tau
VGEPAAGAAAEATTAEIEVEPAATEEPETFGTEATVAEPEPEPEPIVEPEPESFADDGDDTF